MKSFIIAIIVVIDLIIETTLLPFVEVMGVKPNMLLTLIAAFAFMDDRLAAVSVAIAGGLLQDIIFADIVGPTALLHLAFAYGFIVLRDKVAVDRVIMPAIMTFDAAVVYNVFMAAMFALSRLEVSLRGLLTLSIFNGLYTAAAGVIVYNILHWLYRKYSFMNKQSIFSKEK
ncbi:MAG: rod shape-determining protein MreD [Clostridiales bacterium]|jgi:rod shape-determining protein MreD|nr:rod shape-determining protein MreD [Clostridiales bacterium]MDK2991965.1 rod shape-determining protein MreD [Clostridiales bacterium]